MAFLAEFSPVEGIIIGLGIVLIILLVVLIFKILLKKGNEDKIRHAMEKQGMVIIDDEPKGKSTASRSFTEDDAEEEIKRITTRLNILLEKEKSLKKREQMLRNEIMALYNKVIKTESAEANPQATAEDQEIKKVLLVIDDLLEKLPEEELNNFIKSKDFESYKRVMKRAKG